MTFNVQSARSYVQQNPGKACAIVAGATLAVSLGAYFAKRAYDNRPIAELPKAKKQELSKLYTAMTESIAKYSSSIDGTPTASMLQAVKDMPRATKGDLFVNADKFVQMFYVIHSHFNGGVGLDDGQFRQALTKMDEAFNALVAAPAPKEGGFKNFFKKKAA